MIIDYHVHVWEVSPIALTGPTSPTWTAVAEEAGSTELLINDMNNVNAAVLVLSSSSIWDRTYVADSTNAHRDRFR